jgi:phospholipase/carboxylesterase
MKLANLDTIVVGSEAPQQTVVVLLHGYAMTPADLAPFGRSMGAEALYLFPEGPMDGVGRGRAWWPIDTERRAAAMSRGPRDLVDEVPAGLEAARQHLDDYVRDCRERFDPKHLVVGGFSQGGMLACDWMLHCGAAVDALLLLSASRLNGKAWEIRRRRLDGLPVLVSHGHHDQDLAFAAGERLRDFVTDSGAHTTWVPFEGGHEIPLVVWRGVRNLLNAIHV